MVLGSDSGRRLPSQEPPTAGWRRKRGRLGVEVGLWSGKSRGWGGGVGLTTQSLAMQRNPRKQQLVFMGQKVHPSGCGCGCVCVGGGAKWDSADVGYVRMCACVLSVRIPVCPHLQRLRVLRRMLETVLKNLGIGSSQKGLSSHLVIATTWGSASSSVCGKEVAATVMRDPVD